MSWAAFLHDHAALQTVNAVLRLGNIVVWAMIGLWGGASFKNVCKGEYDWRDLIWASLFFLAIALEIGNARPFLKAAPIGDDPWLTITLVSLFISGVGILGARAMQAPDGHKRAALMTHGAILLILVAAGLLSMVS